MALGIVTTGGPERKNHRQARTSRARRPRDRAPESPSRGPSMNVARSATSPMTTAASASRSMAPRSGGITVYVGDRPWFCLQQQLGQQDTGARGRAQRDAADLLERHRADHADRQHRAVGSDRQIGQHQQFVGMAQVLDEADGADVEVTGDERVVQPVRRVFGQHDVEQRPAAHQAPVERQAVRGTGCGRPAGAGAPHPTARCCSLRTLRRRPRTSRSDRDVRRVRDEFDPGLAGLQRHGRPSVVVKWVTSSRAAWTRYP